MSDTAAARPIGSAEHALEIVKDEFTKQLSLVDAIDAKLATIIGYASVILVVFGAVLTASEPDVPLTSIALLGAAALVYLCLMIAAILAYSIRYWYLGPKLDEVSAKRDACAPDEFARWAADEYTHWFRKQDPQLRTKASRASCAMWGILAESGLLIMSAMTFLLA